MQLARATADRTAPEFTSKALPARSGGASKRRWIAQLPADLKGADLVTVFVRYTLGDASFAARLATDGACGVKG